MKKISTVLAVWLMKGFSGVASAASVWNWDLVPDSPEDQTTTTLIEDEVISANYGFGVFAGGFSHKWSFLSGVDEKMDFYMNELRDENILITTIILDNVDMSFDTLKKRWFGGTSSLHFTIQRDSTKPINPHVARHGGFFIAQRSAVTFDSIRQIMQ